MQPIQKPWLEDNCRDKSKIVDYLNVTLDLRNGTYQPYTKPNNKTMYVHQQSNHPPTILKNIPTAINKRLSSIASNEAMFLTARQTYQEAISNGGYNYKLQYDKDAIQREGNNKRRKRNIIWYNPPYAKNVSTNIGRKFLQIIDKEFNKDHVLHKIINRNTVKVSYSCMPNIKAIIQRHNKGILQREDNTPKCNCRQRDSCPLNGQCLVTSVIYQAEVISGEERKVETYVGLTENTFKIRYTNHKASFTHRSKRHSTELSNYIWQLKDRGEDYTIKWKIMRKANAYNTLNNICGLCLAEKYYIIYHPNISTLNERRDLVTTCRHANKHLLCNYKK